MRARVDGVAGDGALVLCYHAVSERWRSPLAVSAADLERQLAGLLERGYRPARFTDAVLRPPAPKTLAVTFDDAYRSVHRLALPVLRRLGVPATVFAPTAFIGQAKPMRWPGIDQWADGPSAPELVPMSWDELGELAEEGWEVGSHTRTHPRLPALDPARVLAELEASRSECEARLGRGCTALAYPYGEHSPAVVAAAARAGYQAAGALARYVQQPAPLTWPRIGIYGGDGPVRFRIKVSPAARRLRRSRAWRARLLLRRGRQAGAR